MKIEMKTELQYPDTIVGIATKCADRILQEGLAGSVFHAVHPLAYDELVRCKLMLTNSIKDELREHLKNGGQK